MAGQNLDKWIRCVFSLFCINLDDLLVLGFVSSRFFCICTIDADVHSSGLYGSEHLLHNAVPVSI